MSRQSIQVDKFLIYDPERSQSTGNVFVSHPTPVELDTFGQLFIITDIHSQDRINQDIINTIQEEVKKHYYQSSDLNIETAFENALQKTNEKLHQLIEDGLANWVNNLNIVIAVLKNNDLHLTQLGSIHAYLIHGPKIVDILEASETPAELEINPLKIFSNIVSGQLNEDDYLLICTSSLLDFISLEKLKRTITGSRPQDAAAYIENLLIDTNQKTTFAAIIAHMLPARSTKPAYMPLSIKEPRYSAPEVSMEEMRDREKQTSELMTPSLWPVIKKNLSSASAKTKDFVNQKVLNKSPQPKSYPDKVRPTETPTHKEEQQKNTVIAIILFIWGLIKGLFILIGKALWGIVSIFSNWKKSKQQLKSWPDRMVAFIAGGIEKFRTLPIARKSLLVVAILLIFVFSQSIVSLGESQDKEQVETEYQQIITDIEQKQGEIDSALIYGNDQTAQQLLGEARDLLAQLPDKKSYQDERDRFNQSLQERSDKINHINVVNEPTELFDFGTMEEGAAVRGMVKVNDQFFAFNSNNNSIYGYNLDSQESDIVTNEIEGLGNLQINAIPENNNYVVFYTNADKIVRFSVSDGELQTRDITFANQDKMVQSIGNYASRLYLLDTKNNQIFRHDPTQNGYSTGQSWLNEDLDLTNATSMVVDGGIWVLKADGQIWQLTQGTKGEFSVNSIEPAFSNPTSIYTEAGWDNLYVLDPANNRIVIFNKSGQLVNQYRSDNFDGLKGFAISDDENTIYLLNKTKLLSFSLE